MSSSKDLAPLRRQPGRLCVGAAVALGAAALALSRDARALGAPSPSAASASTIKLPDGPASIRGLADPATVDMFSGQVGYRVPIDVPAGVAGLAPHLALDYSGDLGNGPLGIGWMLGTPMIRRSERLGVPRYTDADELDLIGIGGGGRLVRDPNLTSPQQYWVEGKGTSIKVVKRNARFEVTDADGLRYFLGNSSASREEQNGNVAAWMADWIVDLAGNEIDYAYTKSSNHVYLASVAWGPKQSGAPVFGVQIDYEARPDKVLSYRTGFPITTASRVTAVRVNSFGHTLRRYALAYDQTFALSRLKSVAVTGLDGADALPTTTFAYAATRQPEMTTMTATGGWTLAQRGVTATDVDGDGVADLLRLEAGNHQYLQNRGNDFGPPRALTGASDVDLEGSALVDLDGDARPELVRIVDDTWRAYKLAGSTWQPLGVWPGTQGIPLQAPTAVLVDVNGDGRIDVVRPRVAGVTVNFGTATGMGPSISRPALSSADAGVEPGKPEVRFLDMNGDGLADVVWLTDAWMKIFLGAGDGTFVPFARVPYPWGSGDALQLSNILFGDLNRDGLTDLVRVDAANVTWYRGETDGRFNSFFRHLARPEATDADAVVTIADLNGNGSQDVVWSSPRGLWAVDLAGATSAGMLVQISNGIGLVSTYTYDASGAMAVAADKSGAPWSVLLPVSVPVPVSEDVDPGAGGPHRIVQHTVRDGFWDGVERRFGGFLVARTTHVAANPMLDEVDETRFLAGTGTDRVLRGHAWYAQTANGDGSVVSVSRSTVAAIHVAGLPSSPLCSKPALLTSQQFLYEGVASPIEIRETFEVDGEVRPTVEHHFGRVDQPGDEKTIVRVWVSDDTSWVRDRPCQETVLEGDGVNTTGAVVSDTRRLYGDVGTSAPLPFGQVGKGYLRAVQGRMKFGTEDRWVDQKTVDYTPGGNPTVIKEGGVIRDVTYQLDLFPITEAIRGGAPLTWTGTWDQPRNRVATIGDPNSDFMTVTYDGLGRPTALSANGGSSHVHYQYDWTFPTPKTTVWLFDGDQTQLASEGPGWPAGAHWRRTTSYANGLGEKLYQATSFGSQFIVAGWKERNERGQVVRSAEPFYAPSATPASPVTGTRIETAAYDAQGRLSLQTLPNGATKSVVYAALGQTTTSTDLGPLTSALDGLGRLIHTQRSGGLAVDETADAAYDAADRIVTLNLQAGLVTRTFAYDTLGRLRHSTDPDVGIRDLTYNDANQLLQDTNGIPQSIFYDYDPANGRLLRRGESASPNPATDYVYSYDADPNPISPAPACRLASRLATVTEPAGTAHFCYDMLGRQTAVGRTISPAGMPAASATQSQTYTMSGLVLSQTSDDGFVTTYQHDLAARVNLISTDTGPLWRADGANEIDAAGRVVTEHYANGETQSYGYDSLGLAKQIEIDPPAPQTASYKVAIQRNGYGAPVRIIDQDGG